MSGRISSISIRPKLITAFTLLLAGTIGLGLFAVERLDGVNAIAADLQDNWLPATRTLAAMALAAERFRLNQAMLVDDADSEHPARAKLINEQADVFRAAFAKYQPTIDLYAPDIIVEEKGLARDIDRTWAGYMAASVKFEDLISRNRRDEAVAFENNEMKTGMDALRHALSADLDFQVREGDKAGDRGAAFGQSAHTWIMISVGAMTALCLGAGWSLIQGISLPIGCLTITMRSLADQDTAVTVPGIGRGDEIGSMAAAVQVFKENMILTERHTAEQEGTKAAAAATQKTAMTRTADGFQAKVGNLVALLSSGATELEATAHTMTATSGRTNQLATGVAAAAEQASANVQPSRRPPNNWRFDQGDHPAGGAILEDRHAGGRRCQRTDARCKSWPRARKIGEVVGLISASPGRPICWRSTRRSKRRAPAKPARASRWWRPK